MIISGLSERELIARIQQRLPPSPSWMLVGIGDDAAVVEPERNRLEVLSVDALVEGVHFDRRFTPPEAIGHRALAVNLSDLAAMGAAPRLALLSLALPLSLELADFDGIVTGLGVLASRYSLHVAGGNLTKSPGPLMVDVTVVGTAKRRQVLTRAGARPGDEIYVSGTIGSAAAGLKTLRSRAEDTKDTADTKTNADACIARFLYPEPRVKLGLLLGRNRGATACVDLSDGLADGVRRIAEASGVGVELDESSVPLDPHAGMTLDEAMAAGDDYELLFTARPRGRGRLRAAHRHSDVPFTRIGVCTESRDLVIRGASTREIPQGYGHFR
ncbi:MAG TPA: thiamine-phosphate kinase [Vicinamibacterales bacterium]|nr:thiamine-phosphate kinase [Vicinamibacterales bacterium]